MRYMNFVLAGLFCVLAVYTKISGYSMWIPIVLLIAAGMTLIGALAERAREKRLQANPVQLTEQQRSTVAQMKAEGREVAAIKQIRLWYRDLDLAGAKKIMEEA